MDRAALDRALLEGHERGDHEALVGLYTCAADQAEASGDQAAAGFYMTQAFVFALECGSDAAVALNKRLVEMGRAKEMPVPPF